ncbi:hypothetical protein EB093_09925, partial [bacterium]|nr:hypothetical protein [bacterium]
MPSGGPSTPPNGKQASNSGFSFSGSFTMDQISGNYFNRIKNVPIGFNLSFDSIDSIQFSGDNFWEVKTGPAKITFTGDNQHLLDSTVAPKFANVPISIRVYPPRGDGHFSLVFNFVSPEAPEYFGFEIQMNDAPLAADASANLQLSSFSSRASVILRRYVTPFAMSDFAYNSSIATLRFTAPNSVASEPPPSTSTSYENFRPYLARSGGLVKVSCGAN